jgi:hypothetical protein
MGVDVPAEQPADGLGVGVPLFGELAEVPQDVLPGSVRGGAAEQFAAFTGVFDIGQVFTYVVHGNDLLSPGKRLPRPARG